MVICLERGADLHAAQLMPLPLTVSCSSKIQIGFTFLVPGHPGSPGQRAVKRVCYCVCVCGVVSALRRVAERAQRDHHVSRLPRRHGPARRRHRVHVDDTGAARPLRPAELQRPAARRPGRRRTVYRRQLRPSARLQRDRCVASAGAGSILRKFSGCPISKVHV